MFRLTCFACGTEGHKAANCPSNTYVINNNDNNQNKVNDSNFARANTILDRSNVILPKQVLMNQKNFGVRKTLMKKPALQRKRPVNFSTKMNVAEEVQQEFAEMGINEVNE
ncbi:unnamed protein product [Gordionus sp. m RMFG-2023]